MTVILVLLVSVPLVSVLGCLVLPRRVLSGTTVIAGAASLVLCLALVPTAASHPIGAGLLRVDALSVVFLLPTAFLYVATAVYSVGYLAEESAVAAAVGGEEERDFHRYSRRFYVGLNLFAWSMLCAPAVSGLALLWIAIEITTVVSALLVAIDDTEGATEAAWKYVLIASSGLGIGLLATIVMYYAGAQRLGQSYDLAFDPLLRHAAELPQTPVRLAFVLAVVGFGTKVGLFPVHTWLPDAHAEAPTPVSALLSGSLLAVSFYAILRYFQIARVTLGPSFPQQVLLVFGVASLLLAALYLVEQSDVKRMLAYSSVEHMGILAIGVSFGSPIALAGVLLHVLAHGAAKGNAFMGAGVLVRKYGVKELSRMRGAIDLLPWSGPLFLISIFALSAMPPFGLFRSEFQIVAGGFAHDRDVAAGLLIALVTLAFFGLTSNVTQPLFVPVSQAPRSPSGAIRRGDAEAPAPDPGDADRRTPSSAVSTAVRGSHEVARGEPSAWMVVPLVAGTLVLLVLGVHPPEQLLDLLTTAARELGGGLS